MDQKRKKRDITGVDRGRRSFVAAAATAVAAAATGTAGAQGESEDQSSGFDVIVIGGGFAGVTAARELQKSGQKTLLLEARNRLGGRTFTTEFAGQTVDLGGTWFHWTHPSIWAEVVRYGLDIEETPGATAETIIYRSGGKLKSVPALDIWESFDLAAQAFCAPSAEVFPRPFDPFFTEGYKKFDAIPADQWLADLDLSTDQRDLMDGYLTAMFSNFLNTGSVVEVLRWYALAGYDFAQLNNGLSRYKFKGGTVSLINAMIDDAKPTVRLSSPVAIVSQDSQSVTVTTENDEVFTAKAVVVAVPLNILKDISFTPALDEAKLAASEETHAGFGTKTHIIVEGDYGNISCLAPSGYPINWLFTEHMYEDKTHLIGFGPSTDLLDVNDDSDIERAVRVFLPDAKVIQAFGYQWTADPFSQGTWCTFRPNQFDKYLRALQKSQGRLVFASADWARGWRGGMDGAVESGLRAGNEIRSILNA